MFYPNTDDLSLSLSSGSVKSIIDSPSLYYSLVIMPTLRRVVQPHICHHSYYFIHNFYTLCVCVKSSEWPSKDTMVVRRSAALGLCSEKKSNCLEEVISP